MESLVQPYRKINGLNRTCYYFRMRSDAQAWADASEYESNVTTINDPNEGVVIFEVAEHYYNRKAWH